MSHAAAAARAERYNAKKDRARQRSKFPARAPREFRVVSPPLLCWRVPGGFWPREFESLMEICGSAGARVLLDFKVARSRVCFSSGFIGGTRGMRLLLVVERGGFLYRSLCVLLPLRIIRGD